MSLGLNDYLQGTQRLIRDPAMKLIDYGDLVAYVNEARRMVARRSQCLRFLPPIANQIASCTVKTGGHGYTNPTITIAPPDFPSGVGRYPNGAQATLNFTLTAGVITDAEINFGGDGYFQPTITVTDPTGLGANIVPNMAYLNTLNQGQEVYPFSMVDMSTAPPGFGEIFAVLSCTVLFSNYRYGLPKYDFTHYQFLVRNYAFQFEYTPGLCSQLGQGSAGSFYVYPLPNQTYQMEWDCICDPADLLFPEDPEAIPSTWQDAVKFYAAHLAFMELQNLNSSRLMLELFEKNMGIFRKAASPSRPINPYGRP